MRSILWLLPVVSLFAAASCDLAPEYIPTAPPAPPAESQPAGSRFDAATSGRVSGRVTWVGERPAPAPFLYGSPNPAGNFTLRMMANPNAPNIHAPSAGIAGAVVFLRGIEPSAAKPWDHPPVRVELKDRGIVVCQGEATGRAGFVRRGDSVEMRSIEPVFHVLRARGAAYFSLMFPKPDQPLNRTLDTTGRVELSSGSGYYWASGDLLVVDHPYYSRTDAEGRFAFDRVPPGEFEVVAWLPGWDVVKQERDPESGLVVRQTYGKPLEAIRKVTLAPQGIASAALALPATR